MGATGTGMGRGRAHPHAREDAVRRACKASDQLISAHSPGCACTSCTSQRHPHAPRPRRRATRGGQRPCSLLRRPPRRARAHTCVRRARTPPRAAQHPRCSSRSTSSRGGGVGAYGPPSVSSRSVIDFTCESRPQRAADAVTQGDAPRAPSMVHQRVRSGPSRRARSLRPIKTRFAREVGGKLGVRGLEEAAGVVVGQSYARDTVECAVCRGEGW